MRWRLRPTKADEIVAKAVAKDAFPAEEACARSLTLLVDEKVLGAAFALLWMVSRHAGVRRRVGFDHAGVVLAVTAALPHLLKRLVAQERPDRTVVHVERHGVPRSGRPYDAFPSGHAMHVGGLAAAFSRMFPRYAVPIWAVGAGLAGTRILLLAHWLSDVVVGMACGIALERLLWRADRAILARAEAKRRRR